MYLRRDGWRHVRGAIVHAKDCPTGQTFACQIVMKEPDHGPHSDTGQHPARNVSNLTGVSTASASLSLPLGIGPDGLPRFK
jgi:hypothetical protein